MDKLKVGMVGVGRWGKNLLRALCRVETAEVVAVCDSNLEALAGISGMFSAPDNHLYMDYSCMLAEAELDAVVLATPPKTHVGLSVAALVGGKHVFVEKPMALSASSAEIVGNAIGDRTFMVGHVMLYNNLVCRMKGYVDDGSLGDILYATGSWLNWGIVSPRIDAFWNFGVHPISILLHLFGFPPQDVYRIGTAWLQPGINDVSLVMMKFGTIVANFTLSWLCPTKTRRLLIVGRKAAILFDDVAKELRIIEGDSTRCAAFSTFGEFHLIRNAGRTVIPQIEYTEPLLNEMEHFVDCCLTGREPRTGFGHGMAVTKIMESAVRL